MDAKEGMEKLKKKFKKFQVSSSEVIALNSKLNQTKNK